MRNPVVTFRRRALVLGGVLLTIAFPAFAQWQSTEQRLQTLTSDLGGVRAIVKRQRVQIASLEASVGRQEARQRELSAELQAATARAVVLENRHRALQRGVWVGAAVALLAVLALCLRRGGSGANEAAPGDPLGERLVGVDARLRALEQESPPFAHN